MPVDTERLDAFAVGVSRLAFGDIDAQIRAAAPKCPFCARPDGGLVRGGQTPLEAGLVDRTRCPNEKCPMKAASPLDSSVVYRGPPT